MITLDNVIVQPKEIVNSGFLKHSPVNTRFDFSLLVPHVRDAEERWIKSFLGEDLYLDLVDKVVNSVSNYNTALGSIVEKYDSGGADPLPAYETLFKDHLLDLLGFCVVHEALPFIALKIANNGVMIAETEFNSNTGVQGVKFLQQSLEDRIERKKDKLFVFLCDNSSDYPLFDTSNCPDDCSTIDIIKGTGIVFY